MKRRNENKHSLVNNACCSKICSTLFKFCRGWGPTVSNLD